MASTSSSPSMASSRPCQTRFNVFLSFRGEDTRHSFTDHLYAALNRAAIYAFRDNDEIKSGQALEPEIVKAIENSRASIVVLSQNYAKSRWCLEELSLILEQKRKRNHFVLPVFYHVDPSDVRNQRRSFFIEAKEGIEATKWTEVNVTRWKSALTEVANLAGMVVSGSETEFIANIVDRIDSELDLKLISTPAHLTGMETRAEYINSWLKDEHSNTNVLAVCGMGGSGKTTLAQYIYNSNKHNFESACFLEDIGKHSKETYGLLGLQKQLLTDILGGNNKMISCVAEGTTKINNVLQMKKVLIVLDDIDELDELDALLGTKATHTQSKIIVTTRRLDIHSWFESISWRCHVHEHKLLNDHESLEVLSYRAFGSKLPLEGFGDLAIELAQHCGGNPLALKVLGSSLFVSVEDPRERNYIVEIWKSRLNSMSSLKGDLDSKIQGVLQKSFDSLPHAREKELFLHIVAFFVGEDEDYVVKILENDWHAKDGIMTLINRCLLTISLNKKLVVHQLLQDMARTIDREESRDHAKRSRVWCDEESYCVLTKGNVSETIEGITLDTRKLNKCTKAPTIKTCSLAKMHKLKLLQLKYVKLSGSYKNFPKLRWLSWHGCYLRTIPLDLLMNGFLVAIDLTDGNLEKFEPPQVLSSLKDLNLRGCTRLVSVRKLWRLPNLETLILWDCNSLTHVCESIGSLQSLALLNLVGCKKLWKSSRNKKHVYRLERIKALCNGGGTQEQPLLSLPRSLRFLFLDYCDLECHNDLSVLFNVSLFGISLRGNLFEFMPNNIDLKTLRVLNLSSCINLKSILCLPSTIEELYTYRCKSLEKVTFQSARFKLRKFKYEGCLKLSKVQGLFKLVAIKELDEVYLGKMKWIKEYQDDKVDLVGDEVTKGRIWHMQILYEYGIRSTYMHGIKDHSMVAIEHTSAHPFLSFRVSLHPNKHKIQGLNISCLYRLSRSNRTNVGCLFAKIRNITKGVTWIYIPMVYCKPRVNEDAMWLSYWPIGNTLDIDDRVIVSFFVGKGMRVSKCGASLVYMDDGEVDQEEKWAKKAMQKKEVIGGDLSEFEVTKGVYYLCRHDIFKSATPYVKRWLGRAIPHTELQGWRKSHQLQEYDASHMHLIYFNELVHRDTLHKLVKLAYFNSESNIPKIKKAVYRLVGVDFVYYNEEQKTLFVYGYVDSMEVETCVREFEKNAKIFFVEYRVIYPEWEFLVTRLAKHFSINVYRLFR
ncbi:putative TIR domain, P-loop containing nucleoside triphosphate hydrolase [Helianthus annuus]|nr:putative TIR domain, P-loop containing nucleoside triphosphate hydrolase [Helianthus annuus]